MTSLPETLSPETAELAFALGLLFVLSASMLGGLMRTIFLALTGIRLLRMLALPALGGSFLFL